MEVSIWKEQDTGALIMFPKDVDPNTHPENQETWEYVGCATLSMSYPTSSWEAPTKHAGYGHGE